MKVKKLCNSTVNIKFPGIKRKNVSIFSLNPTGDCLLDQPEKPLALPDVLPGVSYGLERQCELSFGTGSKPCPLMQAPCQRLWCTGKTRGQPVCQTRHFPWADGTACGDGMMCMRGVCIATHEVTRPKVSQVTAHTNALYTIHKHANILCAVHKHATALHTVHKHANALYTAHKNTNIQMSDNNVKQH